VTTLTAVDIPIERTERTFGEPDVLGNGAPPGRVYLIALDDMSAENATAPGLIPRLRAVSRWLRCKRHFRRRISRMCRMGSRSVAITPSVEPRSTQTAMVKRRPASLPLHPQRAAQAVITMRGIGDHDPWNG
jgi:hypothetical protein